ncbi:hypothetical protein M5F00_01375 [Acinetobacter sp. ANC 4945]|uniref:Uncharacterized protein n=1 Tax=Acinetobacter amyesii TaxID=2942470 RepID=A0A1T1H6K5_9GAMM|nr:hypothetical protein [Acinetobacter amyesii]MCL6246525.1 hypothetical protein [Acinetobacter amyesii]OOV85509.1 hypothetical protein B1202_02385 [Acinetobacter amyesii]
MKKIIILGVFLYPAVVFGDISKSEFCKDISSYAELVMEKRQNGMSIKTLLLAVSRSSSSDSVKELMESIVEGAFSTPAYSLEKNKTKAINEYSAKIYLDCKRHLK